MHYKQRKKRNYRVRCPLDVTVTPLRSRHTTHTPRVVRSVIKTTSFLGDFITHDSNSSFKCLLCWENRLFKKMSPSRCIYYKPDARNSSERKRRSTARLEVWRSHLVRVSIKALMADCIFSFHLYVEGGNVSKGKNKASQSCDNFRRTGQPSFNHSYSELVNTVMLH